MVKTIAIFSWHLLANQHVDGIGSPAMNNVLIRIGSVQGSRRLASPSQGQQRNISQQLIVEKQHLSTINLPV